MRSVTSVRTVNTKRSAKQFARGQRGEILTTADVLAEAGARVHLAHPLGIKGFYLATRLALAQQAAAVRGGVDPP
jgi:hypothetical protein